MLTRSRVAAAVAAAAVLVAACSGAAGPAAVGDAGAPTATSTTAAGSPEASLAVFPASFDLAVGDDARFIAGLVLFERGALIGGSVDLSFSYLGTEGTADATPVASTTASFLPVPGKEPADIPPTPTPTSGAEAVGVYETRVSLERPGTYEVVATAELDGGETVNGTALFQVREEHAVTAVGDPALPVDNLTMDDAPDADAAASPSGADGRVPVAAIDSRAVTAGTVPDPELHATTVAAALDAGRPIVLVVATPVYCVSRFCGPIVETIEDLADTYGERADFVHIEVWKDFESSTLNPSAAAWIQHADGGNEPWVFLIDETGTVTARWDNVLDREELVGHLELLPEP